MQTFISLHNLIHYNIRPHGQRHKYCEYTRDILIINIKYIPLLLSLIFNQ